MKRSMYICAKVQVNECVQRNLEENITMLKAFSMDNF